VSIPALLAEHARARPDAVALLSKRRGIWRATTWPELLERTCRAAAGLEQLGVAPGAAVGLVGENTPEWIVADLAVQALGARSVALPPQTSAPAIVRALAEARAEAVVCGDQEQVDLVVEAGAELPAVRAIVVVNPMGTTDYDDPRLRAFAELEAAEPIDADRLWHALGDGAATTLFSAGAHGDPRPAELSGSVLAQAALATAEWLELRAGDRVMCALPLATPAARIVDLYAPIVAGAQIAVPESPATTPSDLLEATPTVLCLSPRALELLRIASEGRAHESARLRRRVYDLGMRRLGARLDRSDTARTVAGSARRRGLAHLLVGRWVAAKLGLRRTRRVVVTGGPVATRDLRFFWSLGVPTLGTYGPPEAGGLALAHASLDDAGTTGRPLPGATARILDDGTLAVARASLEAHTGDVGEVAGNGALVVAGRRDDALPDGTLPQPIEAELCESPYIRRAVVTTGAGGDAVALVEVDPEVTARWAAERRLAFSTYGSLVALPEVSDLVAVELAAARVSRFVVLPRQLSVARGELTPLLTVRRAAVAEAFAAELGFHAIRR
jgi:long-chain acyl-CoA synthetase